LNIALNLWLIPIWSWRGAVTATYAAEMTMALAMFAVALLLKDKHNLPPSGK
jgi:O-antigen/teichoic acid export membrane protein